MWGTRPPAKAELVHRKMKSQLVSLTLVPVWHHDTVARDGAANVCLQVRAPILQDRRVTGDSWLIGVVASTRTALLVE